MTPPDGFYDASAPPPDQAPSVADDLARMRQVEASTRLRSALDRVADLSRRVADQEAAEGLEPGIVAILERLTGAEDAPLSWRSLHRRVEEGRTTWEDFWARPQAEDRGTELLGAVMREQMSLAAAAAREEEPPD